MITGFILPAAAGFLLYVAFKTTVGFHLAKGVAALGLLLALILFHSFAWASTPALIMLLLLIVGLGVLIAFAHFMA